MGKKCIQFEKYIIPHNVHLVKPFLAGMAARGSDNSNLNNDDGQPNAPIQQQIISPSIQIIVANAAGRKGRAETGGEQGWEKVELRSLS